MYSWRRPNLNVLYTTILYMTIIPLVNHCSRIGIVAETEVLSLIPFSSAKFVLISSIRQDLNIVFQNLHQNQKPTLCLCLSFSLRLQFYNQFYSHHLLWIINFVVNPQSSLWWWKMLLFEIFCSISSYFFFYQ